MPYIDKKTGELVVRIVYDGVSGAGKTASIQRLSRRIGKSRRGEKKSPGRAGRRTEFFDWLDFSGGFIDGHRLRCQLVAVPGDKAYQRRRRTLLKTADAVIFVPGQFTSPDSLTQEAFAQLNGLLGQEGQKIPLVVQAPRDGLTDRSRLRTALGLANETPIADGGATSDVELDALLQSVRLIGETIGPGPTQDRLTEREGGAETPDELLRALQEEERPSSNGAPSLDDRFVPRLPSSATVADEHVWPSKRARVILSRLDSDELIPCETIAPWAPAGTRQFKTKRGDLLHTSDSWEWSSLHTAEQTYRQLIDRYSTGGQNMPPGRVLLLAKSALGWQQWLVTRPTATLADQFRRTISSRKIAAIIETIDSSVHAINESVAWALDSERFPGLEHVAVHVGIVYDLRLPGLDTHLPASTETPTAELRKIASEAARGNSEILSVFHKAITIVKARKD